MPSAQVAAPTGRRGQPAVEIGAEAAGTPTGRRRKVGDAPVAEAPVVEAPVVEMRSVETAVVEIVVASQTAVGEVVELAPRSHRRAAAPRGTGHRKTRSPHVSSPSGTALVAGAAAVAVAAVGAVGAAQSGAGFGVGDVEMARAATVGLTTPNSAAPSAAPSAAASAAAASVAAATADPADIAAREQARASRERAREALADRARAAVKAERKAAAQAKEIALAKERAERLARLAKSYRLPVKDYRLTSYFGQSGGYWSSGYHTGMDFAAAYGTPVRAIANGTVIFAGWDGSYGWKTVIRHEDGTETWYAHQSQLLIRQGQVAAGDIIGRVGSTGNSTGPHLHLEVHEKGGGAVDPRGWLRARGINP